jgi:hypothetical protein
MNPFYFSLLLLWEKIGRVVDIVVLDLGMRIANFRRNVKSWF